MSENINPWTPLSAESKYENPWINVVHHEVLNPSGKPGVYGTVHFKNLAIGIIPITDDGYTYLVGQYRFPLNQYSWEIPMGGGVIGQDKLNSAKRELLEEVGLEAENWREILTIHTSNAVTDEVGYVYVATNLTQKTAQPEETEQLKVKKVKFEEAFQMAMNGQITDSLSISGIMKWKLMLQESMSQE